MLRRCYSEHNKDNYGYESECAMSFLSLPTTPSLSPIGFSPIGFKAYASENSGSPASVALLLLLSFLCAVWKCEQFSLFTSAVTWGIIWVICSRAPAGRYAAAMGNGRRKGGYGGGIGIGGGAVMLAGSLLLAGVCDRASGVRSPWVKVCALPPNTEESITSELANTLAVY